MKILQLIHKPQPRGAETFAAQLSSQLEAQGHTSKLVAIYEGGADAAKYNKVCIPVKANPKAKLWDRGGLEEPCQYYCKRAARGSAGQCRRYP